MSISSQDGDVVFNVFGQNFNLVDKNFRIVLKNYVNGRYTGEDETPIMTIDSSWHAHYEFENYEYDGEWRVSGITGDVNGVYTVIWGED